MAETESEEMAWVRYDDQFSMNAKVGVVLAEDPGALALHLLATTWTSARNKNYGHIPPAQAVVLLADRGLAAKWSALLVQARLWHCTERLDECQECAEEYADLNRSEGGWVIHNADKYRPPASQRQVPGTPEELSAKRAEAGRRGGLKTQARGRHGKQGSSKSLSKPEQVLSNTPSPVPVPEPVVALTEQQEQPLASLASSTQSDLLDGFALQSAPEAKPDPGALFDEFWATYPRRQEKGAARKAWDKACGKAAPERILAAVARYRDDPNRDETYTAYPATWLNKERWHDEPLPPRFSPAARRADSTVLSVAMDLTAELLAEQNHHSAAPLAIEADWGAPADLWNAEGNRS